VIERISYYSSEYFLQISYSLFYFAFVAVIGLLLILRRASLFGLVLSQSAQFSFFLGAALFLGFQSDVYNLVNMQTTSDFSHSLHHLDSYVFPVTLLVITPLIFLVTSELRNVESLLAAVLIFFAGLIPLTNAISSGNDGLLIKAYFTEILYTQPDHFAHYLWYAGIILVILVIYFRRFILAGFDTTQAKLNGVSPRLTNVLFYFLAGLALAITVRVLGVYVTMAAVLVPGLVALQLFSKFPAVILSTILFSLAFTITGFLTSFIFDSLPAEPVIITSFCLFASIIALIHKVYRTFS